MLRLSDHVWFIAPDPDPDKVRAGIGVVASSHETLLIDAGQSPAHAHSVKADLEEREFPPVSNVVFTHHHWDHVWGAQVWDARTIGHELCRDRLIDDAAKPWGPAYLEAEMKRDPSLIPSYSARLAAVDDWDELRITPPDITFMDSHVVVIDDIAVRLQHVGGQHSPDSVVVRVPGDRVMFLGDSFYPPPYHERGPDDDIDVGMLASFVDNDIDWYVDSHGEPTSRADAQEFVATRLGE